MKESGLKNFLKKRAPIYLAVVALVVVFVVPELTKSNLQSHLPDNLTEKEDEIMNILLEYDGMDGTGLSLLDALSNKIKEEYPNENIYDDKDTSVELQIEGKVEFYQVLLNFKTDKGQLDYSWDVDNTGKVTGNNSKSKHIVDLVDFYD